MNLRTVPAREGLQWALLGIRTFWRQPMAMSGLFFLFMAVVSVVSLVPVVGGALALVLLPGLTAGIMAATQKASEGVFPMPGILLSAFKDQAQRKPMLQLGGLYALGFLLLMVASMLADGGSFARVYLGGAPINVELVNSDAFQAALWVSMLLYIPLSMLFWHAPALVYWHDVAPIKSLFFSLVAILRNTRAYLAYGALWLALSFGAGLGLMVLTALTGSATIASVGLLPLALWIAAMFFCLLWFTFRDSFATDLEGSSP